MENTDQETEKTLLTYSDGSQVITQTPANASVMLVKPNTTVVKEDILNTDDAGINDLTDKLMTHTIEVDTISGNISAMPNQTDTDTITKDNE